MSTVAGPWSRGSLASSSHNTFHHGSTELSTLNAEICLWLASAPRKYIHPHQGWIATAYGCLSKRIFIHPQKTLISLFRIKRSPLKMSKLSKQPAKWWKSLVTVGFWRATFHPGPGRSARVLHDPQHSKEGTSPHGCQSSFSIDSLSNSKRPLKPLCFPPRHSYSLSFPHSAGIPAHLATCHACRPHGQCLCPGPQLGPQPLLSSIPILSHQPIKSLQLSTL